MQLAYKRVVANKGIPGIDRMTVYELKQFLDVAGNYLVEFMVLLQSVGTTGLTTVGVQINGTFSEPSLVTASEMDSNFKCITFSAIVTLAEDDELTLAVSNTTGIILFFEAGMNANLHVIRLES
ncbi:hypothetical protein ACFLKB_01885 [Clostridium sp. FAM 1755]|uniref:hypothetical protein n=1 Tax=Clostridium TaxID=1485 RepID=UPI001FAC8A99|nr:hypothetical protein [Clostridium sporogenes]